jgi:hypothetical protein
MRASNRDTAGLVAYQAQCNGRVEKDAADQFVEEYSWGNLLVNRKAVPLPADDFRQDVSLAPNFKLSIPNLSHVDPALIGPITDLLTFYADARLAMRQDQLRRPGDRVYVRNGRPNSWADGKRVLLGEDAIDFDIRFENLDKRKGTAIVVIRHVPPKVPQIRIPAPWMRAPVVDRVANNWVQVSRAAGMYAASAGEETFDVRIALSLADGRIVSASMVNPVEAVERECTDAALTSCGPATRYEVLRKVRIDLQQ